MQTAPERKIVEHGPSVGTLRDRDIPAFYVTADGIRHEYDRPAELDAEGRCDLEQLAWNESVIAPGLIYRAMHAQAK
jgi:hypothetical protein